MKTTAEKPAIVLVPIGAVPANLLGNLLPEDEPLFRQRVLKEVGQIDPLMS